MGANPHRDAKNHQACQRQVHHGAESIFGRPVGGSPTVSEYLVQGTIVHGRYCIERSIATTSASIVYAGIDLPTHQEVIIKRTLHGVCAYGAHCQACRDLAAESMI